MEMNLSESVYSPKISLYISGRLESDLHNYIEYSKTPMELRHCKPEKQREKKTESVEDPRGLI